jgi:hypothetical protein
MKQKRYSLSIADIISIIAIIFGVVVLALYAIDQARDYNFVDIHQPVELSKNEYRIGEMVSGFFYGEIYTNNQPVVLRRIECKNQRLTLRPVTVSSATASKLTGKKVPIVKLTEAALSVEGAEIEPDTDCIIHICSTYKVQPVFGNPRILDECYITEKFSIVKKDAPKKDEKTRPSSNVTIPSIEANPLDVPATGESNVSASAGNSRQSQSQSQSQTSRPQPQEPEEPTLVERITQPITNLIGGN